MRTHIAIASLSLGLAAAQQGFDVLQSTSQLASSLFADYNSLQAFLPALVQDQSPLREELPPDMLLNVTILSSRSSPSTQTLQIDEVAERPETTPGPSIAATQPHSPDPKHILEKRQTTTVANGGCPRSYSACNDGNLGWCCATTAACSRDYVGNVGCCNYGAVCTGTIGAPSTSTTTASTTQSTSTGTQSASTTTVNGATQTGAGFIMVSGNPVATIGGGGAVSGASEMSISRLWSVILLCGLLVIALVP
jgi:hypothetical protein